VPGVEPPMLSSFLKTLAQAEPLGPPSQRDMYPVIWIDMTKMQANAAWY
jgi:hypothetical protein